MDINKNIFFIDFYIVKLLDNKCGYLCKSDKVDFFILPISKNTMNLQPDHMYRIMKPLMENFKDKKIISLEGSRRVHELRGNKPKFVKGKTGDVGKFEQAYGNGVIGFKKNNDSTNSTFFDLSDKYSVPIYIKLGKIIDGKNGEYKICDVKDKTGAKQVLTINNSQSKNMIVGGVYYISELKLNAKGRPYITYTTSILPATSEVEAEFKDIPCGDILVKRIIGWEDLQEYFSCPKDKKRLLEDMMCPKCNEKFDANMPQVKDWRVNIIVMNPKEDDTRSVLLFKRNFIISSTMFDITGDNKVSDIIDILDRLIDKEVFLEYSERYQKNGQFVADKLMCETI